MQPFEEKIYHYALQQYEKKGNSYQNEEDGYDDDVS